MDSGSGTRGLIATEDAFTKLTNDMEGVQKVMDEKAEKDAFIAKLKGLDSSLEELVDVLFVN